MFLFWICAGAVYYMFFAFPYVLGLLGYTKVRLISSSVLFLTCLQTLHVTHWFITIGTVLFTFVLAVVIFIALALMLAWHLYLAASCRTQIEFYEYRQRSSDLAYDGVVFMNEYDVGTVLNLKLFFNICPQ